MIQVASFLLPEEQEQSNHFLATQAGALCRDKGYTVLARTGKLEARTGEHKPLLVGWQRAVTDPGPGARSMVVKCNQ